MIVPKPLPRHEARLLCILLLSSLPSPSPAFAFTHPKCQRARVSASRFKRDAIHAGGIGRDSSVPNLSPLVATTPRHAHVSASLDSDDSYGDDQMRLRSSASSISRSSSSSSSSTTAPFVGLPSYGRIAFFSATTFLIWVSEPLLSLVDSIAVGLYAGKSIPSTTMPGSAYHPTLSSVVQLAALGPATTLCDSSIYLMIFISMATTNKLARAFARRDLGEQIRTMSHVLGLSLAAGAFLLLFVNLRGMGLLAAILGPAGATVSVAAVAGGSMQSIDLTPEVLRASFGYVRIRSIASPLAVMGLTSQAALLSAQDTRTPALAVLVASVVNLVGEYVFVARLGWGVRGAALATSAASVLANGMLVWKVWTMVGGWKDTYRQEKEEVEVASSGDVDALFANEGGDPSEIPFISLPDRKSLASLLLLAGPMFFVMLGKIMGYSAMTVRAGDFGMVSLACHSVMMRVFFFFATAGDAISQAAQTFLPGLLYQKKLREKESQQVVSASLSASNVTLTDGDDRNARTLLERLLLISSIVGIVNCVSGRFIALNSGQTFTNDAALVSLMSVVSPFMGLALFFHPIAMCLEGAIIAARDSRYLVGTYVASTLMLHTLLKFICKDFLGVWHALLLFQFLRMAQFGSRVWKQTSTKIATESR
jgi:Na+-driven multidrug efflux pump